VRRRIVGAAVAALAAVTGLVGDPAAAFPSRGDSYWSTSIYNTDTGKCLTVSSVFEGAAVWLSDCRPEGWWNDWNITWISYKEVVFRLADTDKCLTAPPWNGGDAILYTCGYHPDQVWIPEYLGERGPVRLQNSRQPDKCLAGPATWSNGRALLYYCGSWADQVWNSNYV
jgi:hypothetical protein